MKSLLVAMKLKKMGYKLQTCEKITSNAMKMGYRSCELVKILPGRWLRVSYSYRIGNVTLEQADVTAMRVVAEIYPDMYERLKKYEKDMREFI